MVKINNNIYIINDINNDNDDNDDNEKNVIKLELLQKSNDYVSNIHSMFSSVHVYSILNCMNTIGQLRKEALNEMMVKLKIPSSMNNDDATNAVLDRLQSDKEMLPPPHLPSSSALLQIISSLMLHLSFVLLLHWSPNAKKLISYKGISNNNINDANAVFITYQSLLANNDTLYSKYKLNDMTKKQYIVPLIDVDNEILSYVNKSSYWKKAVHDLLPTNNKKKRRSNIMLKRFDFQNQIYYIAITNDTSNSDQVIKGIPSLDFTFSELHSSLNSNSSNSLSCGLSKKLASIKQKIYGKNKIIIPLPTLWDQIQSRFMTPMEVYQTLSQFISILEEPIGYPIFRIVIDTIMKCIDVGRNHYAARFLYEASKKAGQSNHTIWVCRESKWNKCPLEDLVPGDIVALEKGNVPADCLILQGNAIVNEASQTGESIPQIRSAVDLNNNAASKLSFSSHANHVLKSGTDIVQIAKVQMSNRSKIFKGSNNIPSLRCLVLRTGSNSFQGSLNAKVKGLESNEIYGTVDQRNDYFKLLSLLYSSAILASGYVLMHGIKDERRNMFRLVVQVSRILMSMAPPDLHSTITGSVNVGLRGLAVNNHIHCLEPIKLSVAGMVNTCLFDKTGTLTTDKVMIDGFTSIASGKNNKDVPLYELDERLQASIASCHSLFNLGNGKLTGDPIEIAMFGGLNGKSKARNSFISWAYNSTEKVASLRKQKSYSVHINKTFEFDSELQMMSAVSLVTNPRNRSSDYYQMVSKGSPETIFSCLDHAQQNDPNFKSKYFASYNSLTKMGKRVLALATKKVKTLNATAALKMRKFVESNLKFQGFLSFSCPLRNDTKSAITELNNANMKMAMITGDALMTACYVASTSGIMNSTPGNENDDECDFTNNADILVLQLEKFGDNRKLQWVNLEGEVMFKYDDKTDNDQGTMDSMIDSTYMTAVELHRLGNYNLAITGDVINYLRYQTTYDFEDLMSEIASFKVFARINPNTKTFIVKAFKRNGKVVLMCGDGGNDVGALKAADVGVALLQSESDSTKSADIVNGDDLTVNIGDASIAAPFTSRNPSVHAVLHILRYGRSTQALILQNYQSTVLDSLLNGYSLSVLYLQDTKYSSIQLTALSILSYFVNFGYFMVKPLDKLSSIPLPSSVFNKRMVIKIATYVITFITAMTISKVLVTDSVNIDLVSSLFKPNGISNVVFLFTILQLATVPAITFLGQPFLNELHEIKVIFIPMLLSLGIIVVLLFNLIPRLNDLLQFTNDVPFYKRFLLLLILYGTTTINFIVDRIFMLKVLD